MLIILFVIVYVYLFYFQIVKRYWGKRIYRTVIAPVSTRISMMFSYRYDLFIIILNKSIYIFDTFFVV